MTADMLMANLLGIGSGRVVYVETDGEARPAARVYRTENQEGRPIWVIVAEAKAEAKAEAA